MRGTGTVYTRGATWWIQYSHRGTVYRESSHSTERSVAIKLLKRRFGEFGNGRVIGPVAEKLTLGEMGKALLLDYRLKGNRSIETAQHFASNLLAFFGGTVRAVDSEKIGAYIEVRQESGLSNSSINRETACLRHMFHLMVKARRLSRDHVPAVPRLEEAAPRRGFLEPFEFAKLRDALPEYLRNPISFLYITGWRKGAMRSLLWSRDVELERDADDNIAGGTIRLQAENSKNKCPWMLRLKGELLEVMRLAETTSALMCFRPMAHRSAIFAKRGVTPAKRSA